MPSPSKTSIDSFNFENDAFLSIFDDVDQQIDDENAPHMPLDELLSLLSKSVQDTPKSTKVANSRMMPSPVPIDQIMSIEASNLYDPSIRSVDLTSTGFAIPISNTPQKLRSSTSCASVSSIVLADITSNRNCRILVSRSPVAVKSHSDEITGNDTDNDESKTSSKTPNYVSKSKPEDVLSIRGVGQSKNPGNYKFRELVAERKLKYDRNSNPDYRRQLGEEIVAAIKPGRFLKKDDRSQRFFKVMDHEAAVTKAMFAIRDMKCSSKAKASTVSEYVVGQRKRKPSASTDSGELHSKTVRNSTSSKISSPSVTSPNALTDIELEKIQSMFQDSSMGIKHSRTLNRKPSRYHQIFARIESIASKLETENPLQIRLDLLERVQISLKSGVSFHQFFDSLSSMSI